MRLRSQMLALVLLGLSVSCMGPMLKTPGGKLDASGAGFDAPIPLAVLPFENETTDLSAGGLARLLFMLGMKEKGYDVLGLEETDALLMSIGITQGGQLSAVSPVELQELLGTKGLFYGNILQAEYSTKGISSKKQVTIGARVVIDGEEVWTGEETAKTGGGLTGLMSPLTSMAQQMVDKTFEKAFAQYSGHPLENEIETAVYLLQAKLPGERKEESGWN